MQSFLVVAVATILVTRFYLRLTGFPQVGGGELHIAHMLFGGLLMLAAMVLLLAVIGKRTKRLGSAIGGVGFGLFLDELGKFITRDNDYFFQPTIALIYVICMALFLTFRSIERRSFSPHELLANAADEVRELVLGGPTQAEVARARGLLLRSGSAGPLAERLHELIECVVCLDDPNARPPLAVRVSGRLWRLYDQLLAWRWFQRAIRGVFLLEALVGLVVALGVGLGAVNGQLDPRDLMGTDAVRLATIVSALASVALVLVGVAWLPTARLTAYRWFERSVLVSVLFTQVFMFWEAQLAALSGLFVDLVLLAGLRYMLRQEGARVLEAPAQASGVAPVYSRM